MKIHRRYDLPRIIKKDLCLYGKIPLILLIGITISAICIIVTVFQTRLLISKQEILLIENREKKIAWQNLIVEKNALILKSQN